MASSTSTSPAQRFGGFEVDPRSRELRLKGIRIRMQDQPLEVLLLLLARKGEVVTREELKDRLWPAGTFVDADDGLNTAIRKLREVLGDSAEGPIYIETIPRRGYRFIGPVEEAGSQPIAAPESIRLGSVTVPTGGQTVPASVPRSRVRRVRQWLLIVAIGCVAVIWYLHRPLPPLRVTGYTQITHDGISKLPIGSDGTRLYFTVSDPPSIGQVSLSGGEATPVQVSVPGIDHPLLKDISPDGSSFLVVPEYRSYYSVLPLWNVRVLGDSVRRLGSAYEAAFSPDGKLVAYIPNWGEIWVVRSGGTDAHKLASVEGGAFSLAWSPDGTAIRFTRGKDHNSPNSFWEMSADGSNPHQFLPSLDASAHKCCGRWTPDGEFFLFQVTPQGNWAPRSEIWAFDERRTLFRRRSPEPFQLTTGPIRWERPIPSKDGKTIFAKGELLRGELSRFDSKTGQFQPFLRGISAQGATFSRDGKFVAYVSYPEGTLFKANVDGSNPVQLTDPPLEAFLPRWSPDGTQIAFTAPDGENYIVPAEGGTPRRLVPLDTGYEQIADWSPDGRKVVFSWGDRFKHEVRILDLGSGQVITVPGSSNEFGARWSPDGRYLVTEGAGALNLNVFDFKTQRWSTLPQKGIVASPEWSRDSKYIYFRRPVDDRGVFRTPVSGGKVERIVDLKDWHDAGWVGRYMGLDPTDAPLLLRDIGSEDIYALTLEKK